MLTGDSNMAVGVDVSVAACLSALALWQTGGLPGVYLTYCPMTAGIGSDPTNSLIYWYDDVYYMKTLTSHHPPGQQTG